MFQRVISNLKRSKTKDPLSSNNTEITSKLVFSVH
jgi:hypothetical protein